MTLYEYTRENKYTDFDVRDVDYDTIVTVCYIDQEDETDKHSKFCNSIIKKVQFVDRINDYTLVADWTALIEHNIEKFKAFTKEYWYNQYEDDEDEFVYQWIKEIHAYMGGYVSESFYGTLCEFVATLE